MKKKKLYIGKYLLLAGTVLLLGAGSVLWYLMQEKRDENKIIDALHTLAEDLSKSDDENPAVTLLKIKSIADAFDYPLEISFGRKHSLQLDRENFISHLGRYRAMFEELSISISDPEVVLHDSQNAGAILSGKYSFLSKSNDRRSDVNDVQIVLKKCDGTWKIKSLHFSKVLH